MGKYNYMNLNQKMIRIRKKVPKLIRKRYSEDVTYDFVKLDDIYECLTPALNKYGVDFDILSERPTQMDEQGNSVFLKEMGALWRYEADLELCWTNADRPGDKVRSFLHVIGTNEAPDKAKGAAWTYGLKYYFLNKFNIMQASGIDDPDMRGTEKEEMPKQEASVKPEKPKKKQEKAERKETAAKQEQTEPVREKKTDRKKLRDGNAISEGTVKVEYAVTDTEENLPGQMTFGMEESESGLEEFSAEETKAEDPVQTEEISVDEEITAETDADGFRAVEETDEVPFDEDDEISFDAEEEEETPEETAYLLQTCGDNVFVLREFQLQMLIVSSSYKKPVYSFFERRRILYDEKLNTKEYYFGRHHWTKESRWIQGKLQVPLYPGYGGYMTYEKYNMGNIYGKSLYGIKNRTFRRTGFYEYAKVKRFLDPVSFFEMVKERPYLERLIKAGLYHLAEDIMDNKAQIYCEDSGDLGKALGIDRFRLKRLRTNNGGEIFLQWLLLEKAQNKLICDDVISWMCREKLKPADLMFIMDRMAPLQIKNYLEKQAAESGESVKDLIKTWKDYLNMAIRVGVNVQDSVIYRARKLMQRHDEMIKEIEAKDLILRAGELEKKYPGLNRICRDLKKYEYADKEYQIVVPEKVDDILYEAKLMHHCVNNTETYYERMSQQESYILFLRKAEQPTEAYYTLEVEPDGTIRQTRTFYNQQNEDIELARDFLIKWQKQLKKKLAKEDYKLAVKSQGLRKKEIDELRNKGVRVNGVGYCNKLLAEILEEDLMESGNRELEEQAA